MKGKGEEKLPYSDFCIQVSVSEVDWLNYASSLGLASLFSFWLMIIRYF